MDFRLVLIFFALSLHHWSCRNAPSKDEIKAENREKISILLKTGQQPASIISKESMPDLRLTNDPIVRQYRTIGSKELSRILYNTELMDKVHYDKLDGYSMEFVARIEHTLHVSPKDLRPAKVYETRAKDDLLILNYERTHEDLLIKNALLSLMFTHVGNDHYKLMGIRNNTYGAITIENPDANMPQDEDLELYTGLAGLEIESSFSYIFPRLEDGDMKFYLAKQWRVIVPETGELLSISLAAGTFEPLEAFSNRFFQHKFQVLSYKKNYLEPAKTPSPLAFVPVTEDGVLTDGDGFADIAPGSDPDTLRLVGERFKIIDGTNLDLSNQGLGALNTRLFPSIELEGQTIGKVTTFSASNTVEDQGLTTLSGIQQIQALVRKHLTPQQTALLNTPIATFVNAPSSCNAFYSGDRQQNRHFMVFFSEGDSDNTTCSSTGMLADVVAHEWCHALDDFTGPLANSGGVTDPSFSEGIGDICSAYVSGNPNLGSGFFLNNPEAIRTVENNRSYPDDFIPLSSPNFSPHLNGQIIGGAFWDLRKALIEKYGPEKGAFTAESLFFKHLLDTPRFLESYNSLLILDDDDNNPATRSPNFCLINRVFALRGLAEAQDNCSDDPVTAKSLPANFDLNIGVEADGTGIYKWIGSGKGIAHIELCMGGPDLCLGPSAKTIDLPHSGILEGRDYFTSRVPAILLPHQEITLIATHYYGNKSYRTYVTSPK